MGLLLVCGAICVAQTPKNPELAAEINRLYEIDRKVQTDLLSAYQNGASKEKIAGLGKLIKDTMKNRIPLLKEIIQKHGFSTFDLVGKEASNNFFAMIQHSDADLKFQQFCFKKIKKFVKTKQINTRKFAYLIDRININANKPQIYGTQIDYDKEGNAVPKKLQDGKKINVRRNLVGLEPLEKYLKKMTGLHKKQNTKI